MLFCHSCTSLPSLCICFSTGLVTSRADHCTHLCSFLTLQSHHPQPLVQHWSSNLSSNLIPLIIAFNPSQMYSSVSSPMPSAWNSCPCLTMLICQASDSLLRGHQQCPLHEAFPSHSKTAHLGCLWPWSSRGTHCLVGTVQNPAVRVRVFEPSRVSRGSYLVFVGEEAV